MHGTFTRNTSNRSLGPNGLPLGWFALSFRWTADKNTRRRTHGKLYRLRSPHGTIYRILRYAVPLQGEHETQASDVAIDWPGWLVLQGYREDMEQPLELDITRARVWHWPHFAYSHPDPVTKLALLLGWLSFVLGVTSMIIAFV